MSWDPEQYLAFGRERTRPARELLTRVPIDAPARVVDLGCGPGNSTALLRARFPAAEIVGVDSSREMLEKARASAVDAHFVEADIATWAPDAPVDVLYANASLQWLADHETLLPRLMASLAAGGVLAMQLPRNFEEPCHTLLRDLARAHPKLGNVRDWWNVLAPEAYYDALEPLAAHVDLWETRYLQVLTGDDAVFEWMSGSGLRPFAAALRGAEREAFLAEYRERLAAAYPERASGTTLYPFLRLFVVARAPA